MTKPIRILHLEDEDNDAELIALELDSHGWPHELVHVQTQKEFLAALAASTFDIILADNSGPSFRGSDALAMAREKSPQAAFLFVSGTAVRDNAVAAMKSNSDGFVLKDHISDLLPAIQRALETKKK